MTQESDGSLRVEAKTDLRAEIARCVAQSGGAPTGLSLGHASLDDVYRTYFAGLNANQEVRDAA